MSKGAPPADGLLSLDQARASSRIAKIPSLNKGRFYSDGPTNSYFLWDFHRIYNIQSQLQELSHPIYDC